MTLYHVALLVDFCIEIVKRNDSIANDFLHCLVGRTRGDVVHLDHVFLYLEC